MQKTKKKEKEEEPHCVSKSVQEVFGCGGIVSAHDVFNKKHQLIHQQRVMCKVLVISRRNPFFAACTHTHTRSRPPNSQDQKGNGKTKGGFFLFVENSKKLTKF